MKRAAWVLGLVCILAGPAWAESVIPLPADAVPFPRAVKVELAETPIDVKSFTVTQSVEELRAFYEQALPKAGWRISPLPWQTHQDTVIEHFEDVAKEHPEAAADPTFASRRDELARAATDLRAQLHAAKGQEHVILNMLADGPQTTVYMNRWTGAASWMQPASGRPSTAPANVCCTGASVSGPLPFSLPAYPGATVVAKSTSSEDSGDVVLLTNDSAEQAVVFYRKQMAYNGWTPFEDPWLDRLPDVTAALGFRTGARQCLVAIGSTGETGGPQTLITIAVMPRPPLIGAAP